MKNRRGYFLIEALLGIVIFAVLLMSVFSMISFIQRRNVRSDFESEAAILLEDAMEITHSAILADWEGYSDGDYFPVFDADSNNWILLTGEESGLEARYSRKVVLEKVCRDESSGEIVDSGPCEIDPITRRITVQVWWMEEIGEKRITASLLILNTND